MRPIVHLTAEEIIEIQKIMIERFGGQVGLRDRGLLESAVYRPQSGYYSTLYEQAAALIESLCKNHPFVDGNKRVAWTATKVFLLVNDIRLSVSADEAETFILSLIESSDLELIDVARWIEDHSMR